MGEQTLKNKLNINPYVFRQYDIRGTVNKDLTEEFVYELGLACGTYFRRHNVKTISLGRDCRLSSPTFRDCLVKGLLETGCIIFDAGVIPTPLLYFSLFKWEVDGGIQITGSHNPPDQNGFKICKGKSTIFGEEIQNIRKIMEKRDFIREGSGTLIERDIKESYIEFVSSSIKAGQHKVKAVIDAGNGTGGMIAAPLYKKLGFDIVELFCEPDGNFPNHHPDPTVVKNMDTLIRTVISEKADVGIAFDGDADRIGVVDEKGEIIWGDQLMIIFSREILKESPGATFIAEVKCSQTLFEDIKRHGGVPIMWRVGHSLIKAKMKEENAALAGEMSGHIFFSHRYFGYDDAIYAGARLLEILAGSGKKISELLSDVPKTVTTPEIRVECPDEKKFDVVKRLAEFFKQNYDVIEIDGARINFDGGWGLIRASNTQPVLVLRFEAKNETLLEEIRSKVETKLKEFLT